MSESAVLLAAFSVVSACIGGLIWIIKFLFEKLLPRIDAGNEVLEKLVTSTDNNTKVTASADQYLRDRNGRDAEIHEQLSKTSQKLHKELVTAVNAIPATITKTAIVTAKALSDATTEQHIETQTVEKQVINKDK